MRRRVTRARDRGKEDARAKATRDPRANHAATPRFYTRSGVREKLGLPDDDIRRLVVAHRLRAERTNSGGYALYSEAQIQRLLAMKADGTLLDFEQKDSVVTEPPGSDIPFEKAEALQVFALIKSGKPLQDIVIDAGVDPRVVDRIRFEWDKLSGSMTIPATLLAQINTTFHHLPASFPIRAPSQLIELLDLCQQERLCGKCKSRGCASECAVCIQNRVAVEQAEKHELAVRDAIAACIIAIESKPAPKQPWTRDEVVANLRAMLMQKSTTPASTIAKAATASPAQPKAGAQPTRGATSAAQSRADQSKSAQPNRDAGASSSSPSSASSSSPSQ